ncbi:MAG: hypothetical protein WCK48_01725 [bacterium]
MEENTIGIMILLGIVAIALFGGVKNMPQTTNVITSQAVQQSETDILKQKLQLEADKNKSPYKGMVSLQYVTRSTNPAQEYVTLRMSGNATSTVQITGWKIKSLSSGSEVEIPKGTYLYFANSINSADNILLTDQDVVYVITGTSPLGYSFKTNKCSGYMSQFQTFVPYLSTNCPAPRNEDLSSIPSRVENDNCFDYIDSFPSCRIQTDLLPNNYSYECRKFIIDKINYGSCVDTHKSDKDFYQHEWRVYLGRSDHLWKDKRENIALYDNNGKLVDSLTY